MRLGINLRIDVTKLDKSRIFVGKNGKYIDLTCFIDTENTGQFGDNGTVTQETTPEERKNGIKLPILGNARVFYTDGGGQRQQQPSRTNEPPPDYDSSDIPF